ncbi:MAG: hypothetical protein M0Z83_10515 [Betaproteobacteria bacterium]|nr:hypothetical protein [Betaproteobacteria bacterium]
MSIQNNSSGFCERRKPVTIILKTAAGRIEHTLACNAHTGRMSE